MTCKYCAEPITDTHYTYMYFADEKKHLPVHNDHITIKLARTIALYDPFTGKEGNNGTKSTNTTTPAT